MEIELFDREAGCDRRRRCRCILLPAQRDHFVVRVSPRQRRHRAARTAFQFDVIDAPGGRDDEVRTKPGRIGLHENMGASTEEHSSELQSLMRLSYGVFCLKQKTTASTSAASCDTAQCAS